MMTNWMPVVAGALKGENGLWLMYRRPLHKAHGGLWEFPGGKVESNEIPSAALIRELHEELGVMVEPKDCVPAGFAQEDGVKRVKPIVILLYTVSRWHGTPAALEGGEISWFAPQAIAALDKPPLDIALTAQFFSKP